MICKDGKSDNKAWFNRKKLFGEIEWAGLYQKQGHGAPCPAKSVTKFNFFWFTSDSVCNKIWYELTQDKIKPVFLNNYLILKFGTGIKGKTPWRC